MIQLLKAAKRLPPLRPCFLRPAGRDRYLQRRGTPESSALCFTDAKVGKTKKQTAHKYENSITCNSTWVDGLHGIGLGQSARSQGSGGGGPLPKIGYGLCERSKLLHGAINCATADLPGSNLERYRSPRHSKKF